MDTARGRSILLGRESGIMRTRSAAKPTDMRIARVFYASMPPPTRPHRGALKRTSDSHYYYRIDYALSSSQTPPNGFDKTTK